MKTMINEIIAEKGEEERKQNNEDPLSTKKYKNEERKAYGECVRKWENPNVALLFPNLPFIGVMAA